VLPAGWRGVDDPSTRAVAREPPRGFKDADGRAAVPYLLVFETKPDNK